MNAKWLVTAALALGMTGAAAAEDAKPAKGKGGTRGAYAHVVVFTMKKGAPKGAVADAIADCHKLLAKIDAVRGVRAGRPSKEATPKLARTDYDFALLILVDDAAGLKSYLEDPLHLQFVEKHGKHFDTEKLLIFDFLNQKK
jgi:hypothetical protein